MCGLLKSIVAGLVGYVIFLLALVTVPAMLIFFLLAGLSIFGGILALSLWLFIEHNPHLLMVALSLLAWGSIPAVLGAIGYHFHGVFKARRLARRNALPLNLAVESGHSPY